MARFYEMSVQPTFFGEATVFRNWGRIGTRGQQMMVTYAEANEAAAVVAKLQVRNNGVATDNRLGIRDTTRRVSRLSFGRCRSVPMCLVHSDACGAWQRSEGTGVHTVAHADSSRHQRALKQGTHFKVPSLHASTKKDSNDPPSAYLSRGGKAS
ncbi:WGR domain-containing protein [Cypionkella sp.]|uniref:WGR domain-containing protein n=1 Tax=Cypionkella sp. TaxID=2811411 RepID=UPI002630F133|nr:WGR domain-containing protein [Cypionkella sp.]